MSHYDMSRSVGYTCSPSANCDDHRLPMHAAQLGLLETLDRPDRQVGGTHDPVMLVSSSQRCRIPVGAA
jgi:hypothetical protein